MVGSGSLSVVGVGAGSGYGVATDVDCDWTLAVESSSPTSKEALSTHRAKLMYSASFQQEFRFRVQSKTPP